MRGLGRCRARSAPTVVVWPRLSLPSAAAMRAHLVLDDSVISRAPEAAENLAADGIVPIPERIADRSRTRRPGPTAKHLILGPEERLRVLPVGKALEAGIRQEIAGSPLPDIA